MHKGFPSPCQVAPHPFAVITPYCITPSYSEGNVAELHSNAFSRFHKWFIAKTFTSNSGITKFMTLLFKIKHISVNTCFDNRTVNEVVVTWFAKWQFNVLSLVRKYPFSSLSFFVINMGKFLTG